MTKTVTLRSIVSLAAVLTLSLAAFLPALAGAQSTNSSERGKPVKVKERVEERKAKALLSVEEKRANRQEKTKEARTAACEKRKDKITAQYTRLSQQANRHAEVIDNFYTRVQGFYESGQLTVSNYDELNTAVETAQTEVKTELEALAALSVEIDCENEDVAAAVVAFRTTATETREGLKEYRKALVALISSLRAEAAEAEKTEEEKPEEETTESEQTETETDRETETENPDSDVVVEETN